MATEATITTATTAGAAGRVRTVRLRLFVEDSTDRVVFAEAGEDAVAFVLADPRAAVAFPAFVEDKEGLGMIWASLHSKTVQTDVFRSAVVAGAGAGAASRRRRHRR